MNIAGFSMIQKCGYVGEITGLSEAKTVVKFYDI